MERVERECGLDYRSGLCSALPERLPDILRVVCQRWSWRE